MYNKVTEPEKTLNKAFANISEKGDHTLPTKQLSTYILNQLEMLKISCCKPNGIGEFPSSSKLEKPEETFTKIFEKFSDRHDHTLPMNSKMMSRNLLNEFDGFGIVCCKNEKPTDPGGSPVQQAAFRIPSAQ